MKKVICLALIICICLTATMSIMAESTAGEGTGVSEKAPISSQIITYGANPPDTSNQTVSLGIYVGDITWAGAILYSDKWVKTSGTTITVAAGFGQYGTKEDAINRVNPLSQLHAGIWVQLVDKSGKKSDVQYLHCNGPVESVTFNVTSNADYYVRFNFDTGYYHSGAFSVY